jgi:hypothetical protein
LLPLQANVEIYQALLGFVTDHEVCGTAPLTVEFPGIREWDTGPVRASCCCGARFERRVDRMSAWLALRATAFLAFEN